MPPVARTSKEMILNEGLEIIKHQGIEYLNVRNIAASLNCSTQPIMYHYKNVDILKQELYDLANEYHSNYISNIEGDDNPVLSIGLRYIKFASEETNLFKFLFESNGFQSTSFIELINSNENEISFIIDAIVKEANINKNEAKELFETIFITAHGMASLIANNSIQFDELYCSKILENAFLGVFSKIKGEIK